MVILLTKYYQGADSSVLAELDSGVLIKSQFRLFSTNNRMAITEFRIIEFAAEADKPKCAYVTAR